MLRTMLGVVIWIAVLAAVPVGMGLLMARPAVAATCPVCFGFSRVADGVYVDSGMSPAQRAHLTEVLATADKRIGDFYGSQQHAPRLLICGSDACFSRIGGNAGSGTGTIGSIAIVVAPRGIDPALLAEALSHVELRGRVGMWKIEMGAVPEWFEQGVAVVAADDRQYIGPPVRGNRCLAGPFPDMPETPSEWQQEMQQVGDMLYAQSACKVVMWMGNNGGTKAVSDLLTKVAEGQQFADLYH